MFFFSNDDLNAIVLSLKLASVVSIILLLISTPLAWWLSRTRSSWKYFFSAFIALPLILPPSVLGFYLLMAMGPSGPLGIFTAHLNLHSLAFSFSGLVLASVIYSLPFVVQPIQNAFENIDTRLLEAGATLRANSVDQFFNIVLPIAKPGLITATALGFAHTLGEFGIILMIGGNIPGETQLASVQLYNHVEALEYTQAHALALFLLLFSFLTLLALYTFNNHARFGNLGAR